MQAFNHSSPIQYNQGYLVLLMHLFDVITQISGPRLDQELTALVNVQLRFVMGNPENITKILLVSNINKKNQGLFCFSISSLIVLKYIFI